MEITRKSLHQRYSDLTDAELLRRARSGALTELAREVALVELAERGISIDPQSADDAIATASEDLEFLPDEFERNPYQPPRLTALGLDAARRTQRWRIPDWLWLLYAMLYGLASLWYPVQQLIADGFATSDLDWVASVFALGGLLAWRVRIPLFSALLWVVFLALYLALTIVQLKQGWIIAMEAGLPPAENYFLYGVAIGLLLNLPMFWGLAHYAFASPSIWRREHGKRGIQPERGA